MDYEKKGYEDWIAYWIQYNDRPLLSDCPMRKAQPSEKRAAYIKGWKRAHDEFMNN